MCGTVKKEQNTAKKPSNERKNFIERHYLYEFIRWFSSFGLHMGQPTYGQRGFFDWCYVLRHGSRFLIGQETLFDGVWPSLDAAEFQDVGIAELGQGGGGNFTAPSAAAVDENHGLFVRQQGGRKLPGAAVGHENGTGDVAAVVFCLLPDIQDDAVLAGVHNFFGLFLGNAFVLQKCLGGFGGRFGNNDVCGAVGTADDADGNRLPVAAGKEQGGAEKNGEGTNRIHGVHLHRLCVDDIMGALFFGHH